MCVISEGPIRPVQLVGKSNKFLWSSDQITGSPGVKNVGGAEPLTAVALTMVCKELYELVALGHVSPTLRTLRALCSEIFGDNENSETANDMNSVSD